LLSSGQMPGRAVKFPTGPSNSRLYGGNVKSNALGLPGGLIAVGFDSYITYSLGLTLICVGSYLINVHSPL
jgi:hypothetical protein